MANIAKIRLAPGESGYYDDISNISLNWRQPETFVSEGTDCRGLIRSVKAKRLIVLEGDLGQNKSFKEYLQEIKNKQNNNEKSSTIKLANKTTILDMDTASSIITDVAVQETQPNKVEISEQQNTEIEEETVEPLIVTPKSIKSLTVGGKKEVNVNHDIISVKIADEETIAVYVSEKKIVIEGITVGKTYILIETAAGNYTLSVNVKG
jgi:hypothetical protein